MRKLRFGGPNLPDIAVTFYRHINPDGTFAGQVNIGPGREIDGDRVMDAQSYVDRGMASWIDEPKTAAVAATKG